MLIAEVEVPFINLTTSSPDTDVDTGAPVSGMYDAHVAYVC